MSIYEIEIKDELEKKLKSIANTAGLSIKDMIEKFLSSHLMNAQTDLIVQLYKDGSLTATKAWKLSGLSFDEFMAMTKD